MEIYKIKVTGTDDERTHTVKIRGELIATHRRDHNQRNKSQSLDRVVTTYALYQRADDVYLLYIQKTIVGCPPVQFIREFASLHLMDLALRLSPGFDGASVADAIIDALTKDEE